MTDKPVQPDSISVDIDALRENFRSSNASSKWIQILLLTLAGLGVLGGALWYNQQGQERSALEPLVLLAAEIDASGLAQEDRWLSAATSQALHAYLDAGAQIQIIDGDEVSEADQSRADWIISGEITAGRQSPAIALQVHLQTPDGDEPIFTTQVSGLRTDIADLSERAATEILVQLERGPLSETEIQAAYAELLTGSDANRAFGQGQIALARFEAREAIVLFEEALELEGPHPVIYAALSEAWSRLGYEVRAQTAINNAFENRLNLTRERQLEIEAQFSQINSDWPRAIAVLTALREFHPDDLTYRLGLIETHLSASNMDDAEREIAAARNMPSPMAQDARIDLAEAQFWYQKGDYSKGAEATQRAEDKARQSGHIAVLADALLRYTAPGGGKDVARLEEARELFERLNDPDRLAGALADLSYSKRIAGQLQEAEALASQAIDLARSTQNAGRVADVQQALSIIYDIQGRLAEGYQLKQIVAEYYRERDILSRHSIMLENLGISLFKMGRMEDARAMFGDANRAFESIDDQIGLAWYPYHLSRIHSREGEVETAMQLANQALENAQDRPEGDLKGNSEFEIAHILFYRGEFARADAIFASLEESYAAYDNMIAVAESRLMRARIAFRRSNFAQAQSMLQEAIVLIEDDLLPSYLLQSSIVESDLHFAATDQISPAFCEELREAIGNLEEQETALRAQARLATCRAKAGRDNLVQALSRLSQIEEEARSLKLFEPLLDSWIHRHHVYSHFGQSQNAQDARRAAIAMAGTNGWDVSWAWQ